ncbi:MAG: EamA family transporter [Actinobacteria bacterium]|nr:EamA family transporter [Actinomycetota bacterium]
MDRAKILSLAMIVFGVSLAVGGQFMLKTGMDKVGRFEAGDFTYYRAMFIKTFLEPRVLIGLALYVISSISWLVVLSRVDLSYAYPLAALGYVAAIIIAWLVLKEPVGMARWFGAFLIAVGVIFISRS